MDLSAAEGVAVVSDTGLGTPRDPTAPFAL